MDCRPKAARRRTERWVNYNRMSYGAVVWLKISCLYLFLRHRFREI